MKAVYVVERAIDDDEDCPRAHLEVLGVYASWRHAMASVSAANDLWQEMIDETRKLRMRRTIDTNLDVAVWITEHPIWGPT